MSALRSWTLGKATPQPLPLKEKMMTLVPPASEGCGELGNWRSCVGLVTHQEHSHTLTGSHKIYYSERRQSKTSTGRRCTGQSLEETRRKLPRILSLWSRTDGAYFLQNPIVTPCVKCCLSGKLSRNSVPKVFTGGQLQRHPLPSGFQEFRFPDEKQVFSINHIVPTNRTGSVSQPYQLGNGGTLL